MCLNKFRRPLLVLVRDCMTELDVPVTPTLQTFPPFISGPHLRGNRIPASPKRGKNSPLANFRSEEAAAAKAREPPKRSRVRPPPRPNNGDVSERPAQKQHHASRGSPPRRPWIRLVVLLRRAATSSFIQRSSSILLLPMGVSSWAMASHKLPLSVREGDGDGEPRPKWRQTTPHGGSNQPGDGVSLNERFPRGELRDADDAP